MKREKIKATSLGKKQVKLNGQNISTTIYCDPDFGYFLMTKGNKVPLRRLGKNKYNTLFV